MRRTKKKGVIVFSAIIILALVLAVLLGGIRFVMIKDTVENAIESVRLGHFNEENSLENLESIPDDIAIQYKDELQIDNSVSENAGKTRNIIQSIAEHSETSVKIELFSNDVEVSFTVPDMEDFIVHTDFSKITDENELNECMMNYIENAPKKERTAKVTVTFTNFKFQVDQSQIRSVEFVDSLSGGLISGYMVLNDSIIDSIKGE